MIRRHNSPRRTGEFNIKALVIAAVVIFLLGCAFVGVHYMRKKSMANSALVEGRKLIEQESWKEASDKLKYYLSKYPDDAAVLDECASALLKIRPRDPSHVGYAVSCYKRLLRDHRPGDVSLLEKCTRLQFKTGQIKEAEYMASKWLTASPGDAEATMWLAKAHLRQRKFDEARKLLEDLHRDNKANVDAYMMLSGLEMRDATPAGVARSLEWLDLCVERHPDSARGIARRAQLLGTTDSKNKERALRDLEVAEQLGSDDPIVDLMLCEEWLRWRHFKRAEAAIDRIDAVTDVTLEKYDLESANLLLARHISLGEVLMAQPGKTGRGDLADKGLADLKAPLRFRFSPVAVRLYISEDRLDDAARALEEYRVHLDEVSKIGSDSEEFLVLESQLLVSERKFREVIRQLKGIALRGARNPLTYKLLSLAYQETGHNAESLDLYRKYVELVPEDADARVKLAVVLRDQARVNWAEVEQHAATAERMITADDARSVALKVDAAAIRIEAQLSQGKVSKEEARRELDELRDASPTRVWVHLLLAQLASRDGQFEDAIKALRAGVEGSNMPLPAEMALAELCMRNGEPERAIEACRMSADRHPDLAEPRIMLAELQIASGSVGEGLEALRQGANQLKGSQASRMEDALVKNLLLQNRRDEAIAQQKILREKRSGDVTIRVQMLAMPEIRSNAQEVTSLLDEIREIEEETIGVAEGECSLWRLEQAMVWIEQLEQADLASRRVEIEQMFGPCLESSSTWSRAVLGLGGLYRRLGRLDEAEVVYRRAIAEEPSAGFVADQLLEVLQAQGKYAAAEELLGQSGADSILASRHEVSIALGQEKYDEAIASLQQRIAVDSSDINSRILLARLLHETRDDTEAALAQLDLALEQSPGNPAVLGARVSILAQADRSDEALALLDDAVSSRGDFVSLWQRAQLQERMGNVDKAQADYERLVTLDGSEAAGYALLGQFYYRNGRTEEAVSTWESALNKHPGDDDLKRILLKSLAVDESPQRQQRAKELLTELMADYPGDSELLRIEAGIILGSGTPQAEQIAMAKLEEVVSIQPRDLAAWRSLLAIVIGRGDMEQARTLVSQALSMNPDDADLMQMRVQIEIELGNYNVARQLAAAAHDIHRDRVEFCLYLVDMYLREDNVGAAVEAANKATELAPTSEGVQIARSRILWKQNRADLAIENMVSYIDEEGGSEAVEAHLMLINMYLDMANLALAQKDPGTAQEQFAKAGERLERAEALAPKHRRVLDVRLNWYAAQRQYDEIASFAKACFAENQQNVGLLSKSAKLLASSGDHKKMLEAVRLFEQSLEYDPTQVRVLLELARLQYLLGDVPQAADRYREALSYDENNADALNDLAWILAEGGDTALIEEAEGFASRGVNQHPQNVHLRDTRGVIRLKLNRYADARDDFEFCLKLNPGARTRAKALWHLAQAFVGLGNSADARANLQQALDIHGQMESRGMPIFSPEEQTEIGQLMSSL